jgi:hypothetical protein
MNSTLLATENHRLGCKSFRHNTHACNYGASSPSKTKPRTAAFLAAFHSNHHLSHMHENLSSRSAAALAAAHGGRLAAGAMTLWDWQALCCPNSALDRDYVLSACALQCLIE